MRALNKVLVFLIAVVVTIFTILEAFASALQELDRGLRAVTTSFTRFLWRPPRIVTTTTAVIALFAITTLHLGATRQSSSASSTDR